MKELNPGSCSNPKIRDEDEFEDDEEDDDELEDDGLFDIGF